MILKKTSKMIKIDKEKCIGCGLCACSCSEVFEMDNNNKVQIKSQEELHCIKEAMDTCPVNAISVN